MDYARLTREKNRRRLIGHERRYRRKVTTRYFQRLRNDDFVVEFVVVTPTDPNQWVSTVLPNGALLRWERRDGTGIDAGCYVFRAPDGYNGGGIAWSYDARLQHPEGMTEEQQKTYFL